VAQWSLQPPEELQTQVRFPPGDNVIREKIAMPLCIIDFICIVCVLEKINKVIVTRIFFKEDKKRKRTKFNTRVYICTVMNFPERERSFFLLSLEMSPPLEL
jgi:hypothetical protein